MLAYPRVGFWVVVVNHPSARVTAARLRRPDFRRSWWFGLDDREVRRFMRQVADGWESVEQDLAKLREENARLKAALREWQSAVGVARVRR